MTISSSTNRSGPYNGNGSTTVFARTFRVLEAEHLKVYQTISGVTTEVTTGITKDGIGSDSGNVTFSVAPAAGTQITLLREIPLTQETDYSAQGKVSPVQVEDDLDLQEMQIQDVDEKVFRSVKVPVTETQEFQIQAPEYGRVVVGNQDEDGWENGPTSSQIENAQGYAEQAVAAGAAAIGGWFEDREDARLLDLSGFISTIRTVGRGAAHDGGAATYLRTTSLVKGGFQDQANAYWKPSLDNPIRPEVFGANVGGNSGNDDSQAFQNMFDAIMENSKNGVGFASLRPGQRYYLKDDADIIVDPGFVGLYGNGARMTFDKQAGDPDAQPEIATNNSFVSGGSDWTGFSNINSNYNDYTFSGGNAVYSGAGADAGTYAGIYQQVAMVQGQWYRIKFNFSQISFGQAPGSGAQQYVSVGVRDQGPDAGGGHGKNYGPSDVGEEQEFDFKWTAASGTYWLQIKSNNPVTVNDVSLKQLPRNTCIELDGAYSPFAIQYSPILGAIDWRNLAIDGINETANWGIGVLANTDTPAFRSQFTFRDVRMNSFYNGLQTANRAYLCLWDNGSINGCKNANVLFGEGSDAGENMRLANLTISNTESGIPGIINKGRYVHMYGCSVDYVGGSFIRLESGYLHAESCHFEKTGPAAQNYPFDVQSGTLLLDKGYCQLNVPDPVTLDYVFNIGDQGRVVIDNMQVFGWMTTTGALATGNGHIKSRISGIGQKTMVGHLTKTAKTSLNRLSNEAANGVEDWKYCVVGGTSRVNAKETDYLRAEQLTTGLRTSGQKGIKVTRLDGVGLGGTLYLAIPCPPDGMVSQEFYIKVAANAGATGSGDIFIDWRQVRLRGDENGVFDLPADGEGNWWGGEFNVARDVDWVAGQDWTLVARNGAQNTNTANGGLQEFGAEWRTHWLLILNLNNLPVNSEVHICDLISEVL